MGRYHNYIFPNETDEYRAARDALLAEELKLRQQIEKVAALRRFLPTSGAINEDYVFQNTTGDDVRLSDLFSDKSRELFVYNFMWPPGGKACPVCTSFMDSLNGGLPHIEQYYNVAVVAKASPEDLRSWAKARNWSHLTFLSSAKNVFNSDYNAEDAEGRQLMMLNSFRKTDDGIFHTWSFELFYARDEGDKDARHPDRIWPFWSIYEVTLDGRPDGWRPAYTYGRK